MSSLLFIVFISFALLAIIFLVIEVFAKPSIKHLFFGAIAIIIGLIIGALLTAPLSKLPGIFGEYLPLATSIILGFTGLLVYKRITPLVDQWLADLAKYTGAAQLITAIMPTNHRSFSNSVVLDSSVLIDFRVVDIIKTGFLPQKVIVPRFILKEVQNIADSKENERRERGKRGLLAVEKVKHLKGADFEISSIDNEAVEVDHKLIAVCKKLDAQLITTDFNLNKIAAAEGVRVLNINELAQGLRPNLLPGDILDIKLVHIGKDKTQGVGYLEDGTMLVVENGGKRIGKDINIRVERALQTAAGKMYFGRINNDKS